ncbi:hypothetical protein SLE2022_197820 [Rubroshorea leprosula]
MAKLGISFSKKKNEIVKLKKLQKGLFLGRRWTTDSTCVPEDVKEGHFAVIAENGEEPRRFVVPLSCLTHPRFLKLLEKAAEEFGFNHDGALTIPCDPSELETILADPGVSGNVTLNFGSREAMVQSK